MITKTTTVLIGAAFTLALTTMAPAEAHHSAVMYDSTNPMTFKGVVKSFEWTNPHGRIIVVVDPEGPQGGKTWEVETTSPGRLTRDGWSHSSLKPGGRVEVKIAPSRDGSLVGNLLDAKNLDTGVDLGR